MALPLLCMGLIITASYSQLPPGVLTPCALIALWFLHGVHCQKMHGQECRLKETVLMGWQMCSLQLIMHLLWERFWVHMSVWILCAAKETKNLISSIRRVLKHLSAQAGLLHWPSMGTAQKSEVSTWPVEYIPHGTIFMKILCFLAMNLDTCTLWKKILTPLATHSKEWSLKSILGCCQDKMLFIAI